MTLNQINLARNIDNAENTKVLVSRTHSDSDLVWLVVQDTETMGKILLVVNPSGSVTKETDLSNDFNIFRDLD